MSFQERARLITLIAGIVFFAVGVVMVILGVQADGVIDLKSTFASGSIKTGSAGLFVVFFSFFLIITALLYHGQEKPSTNAVSRSSTKKAFGLFIGLVILAVGLGFAASKFGTGITEFIFFMGSMASGFAAFAALILLLNSIEEDGRK